MISFFEDSCNIIRLLFTNRLELLAVRCFKMGAHVVGTIPQVDLETLVAKDSLLLAEDWIGELGVEGRNGLQARLGGRDKVDGQRIGGIGEP